jgi:hypothetical protein
MDALAVDAQLTAHRAETKYLLSAEHAKALARELSRRIASHRHRGQGANELPAAQHHVTTIYFDTTSRTLYRAARSSEQHLKLRAKEYYDVHRELTETATDPRQLVRYQPVVWLEIKQRDGAHTGKQRIALPKADVPIFLDRGVVTPAMQALAEPAVLRALADLCTSCGEPLRADCLVNYRRTAWQDDAAGLRVTIDTGLASFAPPADLWTRDFALVRETLGEPAAVEDRRVLEVKCRGDVPGWLETFLASRQIRAAAFSKFETASSAVHG